VDDEPVSRPLDPVVPAALAEALRAAPVPEGGLTILVLSTSDGWPHMAMISLGEIVVAGDALVRIALWPGSRSTAAIAATGRATLAAVVDGTSYTVRVTTRRIGDVVTPLAGTLACFDAQVASAAADRAPYAVLESGIRFRLTDPAATLARWREVRAALEAVRS
jgi:hypothetical protein